MARWQVRARRQEEAAIPGSALQKVCVSEAMGRGWQAEGSGGSGMAEGQRYRGEWRVEVSSSRRGGGKEGRKRNAVRQSRAAPVPKKPSPKV